ncbi:Auxin-responsive protein [Nymphaea thermarum]|nr:Auxin-responsive protein [Nymphaea thermarum]
MGKNLIFHHSIELDNGPSKHSKAVPKGCLAVKVGLHDDGQRRFIIPITYLSDPRFRRLLEDAQEVYGFRTPGPLQIPCSVDDFLQLKWLMEREHTYAC